MKVSLSKEEKQKVFFGIVLLIAMLWGYSEFVGTTKKGKVAAQTGIDKLEPQIAQAKTLIAKYEALKVKGPVAKETVEQVKRMIPEGAPLAWFPSRITEFFKRNGIEKVTIRMGNQFPPDKELKYFRKITWVVEIPKINLVTFAGVLANLENEEPLIETTVLGVEPGDAGPEYQNIFMSIASLANL